MFDKMKQLYDMQKKAREMQKQLEAIHVEKSSKDGFLRVRVNGAQKVESLEIGPAYLAADKKETLERALCGLINEGFADIQKQTAAQAAGLLKGLEGFKLPGL